jgi:hypothetical protein
MGLKGFRVIWMGSMIFSLGSAQAHSVLDDCPNFLRTLVSNQALAPEGQMNALAWTKAQLPLMKLSEGDARGLEEFFAKVDQNPKALVVALESSTTTGRNPAAEFFYRWAYGDEDPVSTQTPSLNELLGVPGALRSAFLQVFQSPAAPPTQAPVIEKLKFLLKETQILRRKWGKIAIGATVLSVAPIAIHSVLQSHGVPPSAEFARAAYFWSIANVGIISLSAFKYFGIRFGLEESIRDQIQIVSQRSFAPPPLSSNPTANTVESLESNQKPSIPKVVFVTPSISGVSSKRALHDVLSGEQKFAQGWQPMMQGSPPDEPRFELFLGSASQRVSSSWPEQWKDDREVAFKGLILVAKMGHLTTRAVVIAVPVK